MWPVVSIHDVCDLNSNVHLSFGDVRTVFWDTQGIELLTLAVLVPWSTATFFLAYADTFGEINIQFMCLHAARKSTDGNIYLVFIVAVRPNPAKLYFWGFWFYVFS